MNHDEFANAIDELIDGWCERRKLRPLRLILGVYPLGIGLTDDWEELRAALCQIGTSCSADLAPEEANAVVELLQVADRALQRA